MGRFDYLKPYIRYDDKGVEGQNNFYPVTEEEILEVEQRLNIWFPTQLREFYQEIGYGFLTYPHVYGPDYDFCDTNRLNHPDQVASILLKGPDGGMITDEAYELLESGDLPFFEEGDSSRFLIMHPHEENPNAVWTMSHIKIEDSFERFIWRLYYEGSNFYDSIIEAHYQAKQPH